MPSLCWPASFPAQAHFSVWNWNLPVGDLRYASGLFPSSCYECQEYIFASLYKSFVRSRLPSCSSFCPLSSSGQEKGCFGMGFGVFCVCTYPPKGLSKEQGLGVVLWAKWDPIWANWDPSGQFESGKKCSRIGGGEFNHRCQEVLDLAKWLIGC